MNKNLKTFLFLHLLLMVYSTSGVFSKLAAGKAFLSWPFLLLYGGVIVLLGVYALGWQQVLKRVPLSVAYANKAVTVVWGCVWGVLVFREHLSPGKLIGGVLVLAGIALYGWADGKAAKE
jgi:drug/metabolite transporter (DMT)-like permease